MVVADDEGDATEAALDKALEEGAPVSLGFTEGDTHAQNGAMAAGGDTQREKDGKVAELAVVADLFIAGVKHEIVDAEKISKALENNMIALLFGAAFAWEWGRNSQKSGKLHAAQGPSNRSRRPLQIGAHRHH